MKKSHVSSTYRIHMCFVFPIYCPIPVYHRFCQIFHDFLIDRLPIENIVSGVADTQYISNIFRVVKSKIEMLDY